MHHSPSLFFDILTTEDEVSRDEKIKRASFEIKTAHANSPPNSKKFPHTTVVFSDAAAAARSNDCSAEQPSALQQVEAPLQQQAGLQQEDRQPGAVQLSRLQGGDVHQLVLTPQEVLQELLGDMYIDQSRLTMGELLGQGGFADVHAAELCDPLMPAFTEAVAVKRLRPDVLKSPDDLREFLTEANLLRKLQHRNIVRLRGVGATDLTDLVTMRESMFVVQEFMAGGDLKQLVMSAMAQPFAPPYTKPEAFTWAMQIAEAMHYLHSVCCPMIIHRDLKLDNVLLTGGHMHERVAKLADFGLHKRVRKMTSSGALVAWNQETTYHGGEFERSFYGGKLYLVKSAMSIASSVRDDDSVYDGSLHGGGSMHGASMNGGSVHGGGSLHGAAGWQRAHGSSNGVLGLPPVPPAAGGSLPSQATPSSNKPPLPMRPGSVTSAAAGGAGVGQGVGEGAGLKCFDSAASIPDSTTAAADSGKQQHQQQQLLKGAVRAKSQGLLGKQEFVTRVLSVSSSSTPLQQGPMCEGDHEVVRTLAAVQALEGSVRAGSAFYAQPTPPPPVQQQQEDQQQPQQAGQTAQQPVQQQQQVAKRGASSNSSRGRSLKRLMTRQQSELCPQLLQQLQSGLASCQNSQKFIEATQKVGSLMYMAPEVLTGHQYNEKIDVFSFGIILYELLSGVVLASRVAMQGEHDELLDYARQVANGHREEIPAHWPAQVKALVSSCWAQDPKARPVFKQILKELYALKQAGVDGVMEGLRPKGDYNPVTDCGCSIM